MKKSNINCKCTSLHHFCLFYSKNKYSKRKEPPKNTTETPQDDINLFTFPFKKSESKLQTHKKKHFSCRQSSGHLYYNYIQ